MENYKTKFPFAKRKAESEQIKLKHVGRIPVIVNLREGCDLRLKKQKFLCPNELTFGQFLYIVKKHIEDLSPEEAFFAFVNKKLCTVSHPLSQIYQEEQDEDGFLYVVLTKESVFGCLYLETNLSKN